MGSRSRDGVDVLFDDPDDELLVNRGSGWLRALGVLAVAGLLAALIATHLGPEHPVAAPATAPPASSTPAPAPVSAVIAPPPASDVAASAQGTWAVQDGQVQRLRGTHPLRSARLPAGMDGGVRLVLDTQAGRLWAVAVNRPTSRLVEFDAATLRRLRDVTWAETVAGAAAMSGHLYLSTSVGVADLAPGSFRPRFVPGLSGAVGPIAVDPSRHRLIAIDLGVPSDLWTYRPGSVPVEAARTFDLRNGSLAVAAGTVWVGGQNSVGDFVLARLDPGRGGPGVSHRVGLGVAIVGGGSAIWTSDGDVLSCADPATGRVRAHWRVADVTAVAAVGDSALVATSHGWSRIDTPACPG